VRHSVDAFFDGRTVPLSMPSSSGSPIPVAGQRLWRTESGTGEDRDNFLSYPAASVRTMTQARGLIASELANTPPGPELLEALAKVDINELNRHELLAVADGWQRLEHYATAWKFAAIAQAAHTPHDPDGDPPRRAPGVDDTAVTDVADALNLTQTGARSQIDLAESLTTRLPRLHAALATGHIDLPNATAIAHSTRVLPDEAARAVAEQFLPNVGKLTAHQLRAKLRRHISKINPPPPRPRRKAASPLPEPSVTAGLSPDGTAYLHGTGLPPDQTAAAFAHLTRLANATRHNGDSRSLDRLRAHHLLGQLSGNGCAEPGTAPTVEPISSSEPVVTVSADAATATARGATHRPPTEQPTKPTGRRKRPDKPRPAHRPRRRRSHR
jgi:hypothetical protein